MQFLLSTRLPVALVTGHPRALSLLSLEAPLSSYLGHPLLLSLLLPPPPTDFLLKYITNPPQRELLLVKSDST